MLGAAAVLPVHWPTYVASATYTFVYMPQPQGWYVEHAWSLSVEEQFYLLWPELLVFAHRRRWGVRVVCGILALLPVVRVVLALAIAEPERAVVTSSSIDMLMMGCLLALLQDHEGWRRIREKYLGGWSVAALIAVGLVLVPYAETKIGSGIAGALVAALGTTGTAVAIGAMVAYVVAEPASMAGRFLNLRLLRHLGVISYSIYLWQQLFTADPQRFGAGVYLLILAAGEASFWMIERPVMRLRARMRSRD